MNPQPKSKPWRSEKYRKWIADKPCSVCGRTPSDPHHYEFDGQGVMGGKVSDEQCIPLCHVHHREFHDKGKKSFHAKYPYWHPEGFMARYRQEWAQKNAPPAAR